MDNKLWLLFIALIGVAGFGFYKQQNQMIDGMDVYLQWKAEYGLTFRAEEDNYRFEVFKKTLEKVQNFNSLLGRSYTEGINSFSALTPEEFAETYLTKYQTHVPITTVQVTGPTIDWVSYGAVSPVKNQGSCTASYAFSAIGAVEGISVIFFKNPVEYSVQQVVDCTQAYGNNGCQSGRMDNTFNYIISKGINSWSAYPYAGQLQTCKAPTGFFKISGYVNVTDCVSLANALTGRPVSVAVDGYNFQNYRSGIFSNCGLNLSLAVLLVGMTDTYWTLKNAWGTQWGEAGYIRIARGNTCGVCSVASFPLP